MNHNSLVSLIIVSYNHKKYIEDSFMSAISQNYDNIELLFIDDASPDGTFEEALLYAEKLETRFSRVVLEKNEFNRGIVGNHNYMIPKANGEYIMVIAADDYMCPNAISIMIDSLEKNRDVDIAYSDTFSISDKDHFLNTKAKYLEQDNVIEDIEKKPFAKLYNSYYVSAPTFIVRRRLYDSIGLYDDEIATEDWNFLLKASKCTDFLHIKNTLIAYRILETSMSHSNDPKKRMIMKKSELQIIEKYMNDAFANNIDVREKMQKAINGAIADAFYIRDKEYNGFLKEYEKRNRLKISIRNRIKLFLM